MVSRLIVAIGLAGLVGCGSSSSSSSSTTANASPNVDATLKNLESEDAITRSFAVAAIVNMGDKGKEHLPAIKKLLNDPESNVRDAAKLAVAKLEK